MIDQKKITQFLLTANLFVMLLFSQAVVLALVNQFKLPLVIFSVIISLVLSRIFFSFFKRDIKLFPNFTVPAILIIFLVSFILIFFPHDTFGGRDEAIYSNLAVSLANSGSLELPSYLNHLHYAFIEGVRTMLPGYPIWLAIQKILLGNEWLLRNNLVLVILGLGSLFLAASLLSGQIVALMTITLYSFSMPFLWFSRETMTENMSFFLLWALILFLLLFFRTRRLVYLFGVFVGSWLFAITRFEGFLIQFSLVLIFLSMLVIVKNIPRKKIFFIVLTYLIIIGSNFLFLNRAYFQVYSKYFKDIIPTFKHFVKTDIVSLPISQTINQAAEIKLINKMPMFFAQMLAKYNLVLVLFSIFLLLPLFIGKKISTNNKIYLISLLILISPEFFKFINPGVTLDQPWLYRRYMYALLPFGYLCLSILLNQFKKRKFLVIAFSILFIINIVLSKDIIFLKNNWLLINKMEEITKNISEKDCVIIRNWTLGYYYPGSYLILQRRIRSAFTSQINSLQFIPQKKIFNEIPYNKIFLLSNKKDEKYPNFNIIEKNSIDLKYQQLQPSCQLYLLGEQLDSYNIYGYDFLPYREVTDYCRQPGNEIIKHDEKLYLYELIYENKSLP